MNTVSEVLGNAGAPIQATLHDGRSVIVSRLDQAGKTRIEQHLKASARAQVFDDKVELNDAEFQLAYGAFLDRVASSDYKFGGGVYVRFLQSGAGGAYVTRMLTKWADGKDFTEQDLMTAMSYTEDQVDDKGNAKKEKPDETTIRLAVQQAIQESFPKDAAPAPGPGNTAPGK